ncbi:MAG: glucose-1-phosphate adenylyltransferase subunit GlgD [Vulcanibacillus sp.]
MGVINLCNEQDSLNQLAYYRNEASIPFGGSYRLIDFSLSNMINSGIQDIAIFTSSNYRSLMDHLGNGGDWDLDRKNGGLFILPPSYQNSSITCKGDILNFDNHLDFFNRGKSKYILISGGNLISNIDYRPALKFHKDMNADITILHKKLTRNDLVSKWYKITTNQDNRILSIKNNNPKCNKISLETYIIEKKLLLTLIKTIKKNYKNDFLHDGIINNLDTLNVYGYLVDDYVAKIDSVKSYYKNSMNLLNEDILDNLFNKSRVIHTKTNSEPPVKYLDKSEVVNSLIANGCVIEGKVENSILFKGVKVHKEAYIKNSVLMQNCDIGDNSVIINSILDKDVKVSSWKIIKGEEKLPLILPKKLII